MSKKTSKKRPSVARRQPVINGARVRLLREKREMTQLELAVLVDSHPQQISLLEKGAQDVRCYTLVAICDALDCSADYLLGRSNLEKTPE